MTGDYYGTSLLLYKRLELILEHHTGQRIQTVKCLIKEQILG